MKTFIQKPGGFWWTQSVNSTLYAIREFSGALIFVWAFYYLLFLIFPTFFKPSVKEIVHLTGLAGACVHTLTWLLVMPKLLPFRLSKTAHILIFILLSFFWIGLSATLFYLLTTI